jgi:hypothetical protein
VAPTVGADDSDPTEAPVTAETETSSRPGRTTRAAPAAGMQGTRADRLWERLGLAVPNEWWPSSALLKSFEAAGFALSQVTAPPASVLSGRRGLRTYEG